MHTLWTSFVSFWMPGQTFEGNIFPKNTKWLHLIICYSTMTKKVPNTFQKSLHLSSIFVEHHTLYTQQIFETYIQTMKPESIVQSISNVCLAISMSARKQFMLVIKKHSRSNRLFKSWTDVFSHISKSRAHAPNVLL